jgi:hypothetical protein
MFTNYFFSEEDKKRFFEKETKKVLIIDPPFQPELLKGLAVALKTTFSKIPHILLAFPHFGRKAVKEELGLEMTEYRMTYENHKKFRNDKKSIVRLFTNNKEALLLPSERYGVCPHCQETGVHILLHRCP